MDGVPRWIPYKFADRQVYFLVVVSVRAKKRYSIAPLGVDKVLDARDVISEMALVDKGDTASPAGNIRPT